MRELQKKVLGIALNYATSPTPQFGNIQSCTSLLHSLMVHGHYVQQKYINDATSPVSRKDIREGMDWLLENSDDGDVLMVIIAAKEGLELSDGSFYSTLSEDLIDNLPLGCSVFVVSDSHYPLQSRFMCKDTSIPSKEWIQVGNKNMPVLKSNAETKRFEDVTKPETYSSVVCLYAGGTTGHLLFLLDRLLTTTYLYSVTLQTFLQYGQACLTVNQLDSECSLECGQYLDLQVPLGRLLHLPV